MSKTLLLVDDSTMARMVIRRCFEIAGLFDATFVEAKNGKEAIELMKKQEFDLIVSDLNMPEMDGRELLKAVKADEATKSIPVVVITSSKNEALEKEFQELGVLTILSKPVSPAVIVQLLQELEGWTD